ncbi:subtilase family serine protease [Kitasatospora sp. MAA4]|uniref:S53 family peptidase n=1 Tax=Kitasatospora sp. MAA4 TaxID=3035093 RepID=UPI0024735F13|nr:S53 family peptidase [Kitasatospora sp. MAA4]MDH6135704.1 subtilase family serine protease [Kitasatospora sp. MAA4]
MRISSSRRRGGVALAAVLPLLAAVSAGTTTAAHAASPAPRQGRAIVAGTKPAWAQPSTDAGAAAGAAPVTARVYLAGRDQAGLEALARQVSDPKSGSYGHYLTAQQLNERFGPTDDQSARVRSWLTSAGMQVIASNAHYLTVQGDVDTAERAFGTELRTYHRDGRTYRAPAADVTVPAALAADVLSVSGLSTAPSRVHPGKARASDAPPAGKSEPRDTLPGPGPAFVNSPPFSTFYGSNPATGTPQAYGATQPYVLQGYNGSQLRSAYGAAETGLTGRGVKVAIVDAYDSPTLGDDVTQYAAAHGDAPYGKNQLLRYDPAVWTHTTADTSVDPNACDASGWYGEQTLDVEALHGMAPEADISYVGAASCTDPDLIDALDRVVDQHLADIVSNSYGEAENASDPSLDQVYRRIFVRGAVQGIGFYFSSGDDGDEVAKTGTKQSDVPASMPWVTAVGGTSLGLDSSNSYRFETGWGTLKSVLSTDGTSWTNFPGTFNGGAGGGTSSRFDAPFYQNGIVPEALVTANGGRNRVVPDIAAVADPNTGFLVGQTQAFPDGTAKYSEYRVGGTSLACPVTAGLQALAQQAQGSPLGFANPAIYARFGSGAYHDVTDHPFGPGSELAEVRVDFTNSVDASAGTVTSLRTLGKDSSLSAVEGYDDVTGVGTPSADYLRSYCPPDDHDHDHDGGHDAP